MQRCDPHVSYRTLGAMPITKEQAAGVLADAHLGIEDGLERVLIIRAGPDDPRGSGRAVDHRARGAIQPREKWKVP